MLVLDRLLAGHRHILADLARGFNGFLDRLHRKNFRVLGATDPVVRRDSTASRYTHRTQHRTNEH
ncbi:hypothetical protein FQZ97_1188220 [compost metagenome]